MMRAEQELMAAADLPTVEERMAALKAWRERWLVPLTAVVFIDRQLLAMAKDPDALMRWEVRASNVAMVEEVARFARETRTDTPERIELRREVVVLRQEAP